MSLGDDVDAESRYDRARALASAVSMPLMTHHTGSTVPIGGPDGCPGGLKKVSHENLTTDTICTA